MTELGLAFRDAAPVIYRDSPEHLAQWHCLAKELERVAARIEVVRDQFFPQRASLLLGVYERLVGVTVNPPGVALDDRRRLVLAGLRKMAGDGSGLAWQDQLTNLIGAGSWDYTEHIPGDSSTPAADVVRVSLPFSPATSRFAQVKRFVRDITPAHVDVAYVYSGGFLLDESELDEQQFNA